MTEFFQHVVNGIALGGSYALIALGYTMIFGVLKLINFAHGEVYMLGAFIGYYTAHALGLDVHPSLGNLFIVLAASMVGCALAGVLIERLAYRPLGSAPRVNLLITAVGVSLLLQYGGQLVFGAMPRFFPQVYQPTFRIEFAGIQLGAMQIVVLGISLVLMGLLQFLVFKTRYGRAMRAVSFNPEVARLLGISTDKIVSMTFALGGALAGAAAVLVALTYPRIDPLMGVIPGLKAFAAAVLGGIGNVVGAVVGSLIIGLAEQLVVAYGASSLRDALAFAILIAILLVKPTGLFGRTVREKV